MLILFVLILYDRPVSSGSNTTSVVRKTSSRKEAPRKLSNTYIGILMEYFYNKKCFQSYTNKLYIDQYFLVGQVKDVDMGDVSERRSKFLL